MSDVTNRELLLDLGYDDVIIFDNPSYEGALIGVTWDNQAVYDYDLMVKSLMKEDNITEEEAADYISYNASYINIQLLWIILKIGGNMIRYV